MYKPSIEFIYLFNNFHIETLFRAARDIRQTKQIYIIYQ